MKKRMNATLSLASVALLTLVLCNSASAGDPPDNVQGDWTIYSSKIDSNEVVVKHVHIAQYGDRITGYFEGPNQSGPIQGEVKGHHIEFSTVTRTVLKFRGEIYGDNTSGTYSIEGKHAPWQASRGPPQPQDRHLPQMESSIMCNPSSHRRRLLPSLASARRQHRFLRRLMGPIALYPDSLVAQVLAAATYPDEILPPTLGSTRTRI